MRKFYKTTITYEVLSEEPIPGHADLDYIARECDEGEYVGRFLSNKEEVLTAPQMAEQLHLFGSDPGFFQIDETEEPCLVIHSDPALHTKLMK